MDECDTEKAPQERCLLLIRILHPAARQARRGKKLLLERHVYSHRCHRIRQASGVGVTINLKKASTTITLGEIA